MARARYQVLVIPYFIKENEIQYGLLRRSDMAIWQFIAGGGEDEDPALMDAAKREAFEEAGIPMSCDYTPLDTCCSIPVSCFRNAEALWGPDCFVIPEYAFGVRLDEMALRLSHEHTQCVWLDYQHAQALLHYDSNKTALWELNRRLELGLLKPIASR